MRYTRQCEQNIDPITSLLKKGSAILLRSHRSIYLTWSFLIILLLITLFISMNVGSVPVTLSDILASLTDRTSKTANILWQIRYPRIFMTMLVGANMALSGLATQAVLRNPLTDTSILGINAGASLLATGAMILFPQHSLGLPMLAFVGGMATWLLVMSFSWRQQGSILRMILTGIAIRSVLAGIQNVLMVMHADKLQGVLVWLNGQLAGHEWQDVLNLAYYSWPVYCVLYLLAGRMNILQLQDSVATSLGVHIRWYRLLIPTLGVLLASVTVAYVGQIGFIGLIVPHVARLLVGGEHRRLVPYTLVLGALLLVVADALARTVIAPLEIPTGTMMAIVGGPFFIYLLNRQRGGRSA